MLADKLELYADKALHKIIMPGEPLTLLAGFGALAFAIFAWGLYRPQARSLFHWLFPREVYLSKSHMNDIGLFILGTLAAIPTRTLFALLQTAIAYKVMHGLTLLLGTQPPQIEWTTGNVIFMTFLFILLYDFLTYWVHRIHHENTILWPFHKVHHSAEVMTPITNYRKHPIYDLLSRAVKSVLFGITIGVIIFFVAGDISIWKLGTANVISTLFYTFGGNLRHTHIWLHWGKLGYIISSPAMHQIHHSRDAMKHWNKNYAEIFSLWDWMFGTLYIPTAKEEIKFGLPNAKAIALPQPHPTLRAALIVPFQESGRAISRAYGSWRRARA